MFFLLFDKEKSIFMLKIILCYCICVIVINVDICNEYDIILNYIKFMYVFYFGGIMEKSWGECFINGSIVLFCMFIEYYVYIWL